MYSQFANEGKGTKKLNTLPNVSQLIRARARAWIHICMSPHNQLGEKCDADIYTRKKGEQLKNLSHVNFYQDYIMHNYEVSLPWHYGQNFILHLIATYFIHQPYKLVATCLRIFAHVVLPSREHPAQ